MKKIICLSFFLCLLHCPAPAFAGDTIIFDGSDPSLLGSPPTVLPGFTDSLFPPNMELTGNSITIINGTIPRYALGGSSATGAPVSGNQVIMYNGFVGEGLVGGLSTNATPNPTIGYAEGNSVSVYGGTVAKSIYGGFGIDAINNTVSINGGSISSAGGDLVGGFGVTGNAGVVYGNKVNITDGTVYSSQIVGGQNEDGNANNNTVNISGGTILLRNGNIYGGRTYGPTGGDVFGNVVHVSGGVIGGLDTGVNGNVYGGLAPGGKAVYNNTVILSGGFMWGYVAGTASGGAWESLGNTLIVDGPTTVGGLGKFENTFIASSGHVNVIGDRWAKFDNGNDFSLKLQNVHNDGALTFYNIPYDGMAHSLIGLDQKAGEIRGTYTGKGYIGLDARIRPDAGSFDADRIVFTNPQAQRIRLDILPTSDSIQAVNNPVRIGTFSSGATDNPFTTVDPGLGVYAYSILRSGNDYYLALTEDYAAELGQVYSEAAAAVLDQISRTPDLLLRNALNASIEKTNGKGFGMFAVGSYGKERIDTGSHVDVEGIDMLAALAYNRGTPWSVGLFTEYFTGEYNTRNTATTSLDTFTIKSDGDIESVGGGLFVQFRPGEGQVNGIPLGWRFDASARMGVNKMDFGNHTFYDSKFDKSSLYYGTTLGGAYVFTPTESSTLELYSHGIWTRQLGSSVTDDINQRIDFHHADSLRFVAGGRFDFEAHEKVRPFAGIALDWETMGKPEVDIDGFRAKTADLSGASGVAELGMFITIRDGLGLNTKGTATVGKKEGFGGVVQLQYEF